MFAQASQESQIRSASAGLPNELVVQVSVLANQFMRLWMHSSSAFRSPLRLVALVCCGIPSLSVLELRLISSSNSSPVRACWWIRERRRGFAPQSPYTARWQLLCYAKDDSPFFLARFATYTTCCYDAARIQCSVDALSCFGNSLIILLMPRASELASLTKIAPDSIDLILAIWAYRSLPIGSAEYCC